MNSEASYFLITDTNYRVNHRKFKKPFFDLYQPNAYNDAPQYRYLLLVEKVSLQIMIHDMEMLKGPWSGF